MEFERAITCLSEGLSLAGYEKAENRRRDSTYLAAVKCLISEESWLNNTQQVNQVLLSLEGGRFSKNPDICRQITKLYQLILAGSGIKNTEIEIVRVKISKDVEFEMPRQLLVLEGCALKYPIYEDGVLDLSGKADLETLHCFVQYLRTGNTAVITDKNAIAMLELSFEYEVRGLSMDCLKLLLSSDQLPEPLVDHRTLFNRPTSSYTRRLEDPLVGQGENSINRVPEGYTQADVYDLVKGLRENGVQIRSIGEIDHFIIGTPSFRKEGSSSVKKGLWDALSTLESNHVSVTHLVFEGNAELPELMNLSD